MCSFGCPLLVSVLKETRVVIMLRTVMVEVKTVNFLTVQQTFISQLSEKKSCSAPTSNPSATTTIHYITTTTISITTSAAAVSISTTAIKHSAHLSLS